MSGQLCLKWNNHKTAFNKLLDKIYLEDAYSDATILCQGQFYPVHRFVLSTCSDYFEEMFRQCVRLNNKHPFIIVKDIQPEQMEALLNYMYKGEVNVPQEMLPELIKAAEAFKIKGLAVPDEEPTPKSSRRRSNVSSPIPVPKKSKKSEDRLLNHKTVSSGDNKGANIRENLSSHSFPTSSSKESEEINFIDANVPEIKPEPIDPQDVDNCAEESLKYEAFQEDESYEAFNFDSTHTNFDEEHESTSWENSQEKLGNEDDSLQNVFDQPNYLVPSADTNYKQRSKNTSSVKRCPFPDCSFVATRSLHLEYHLNKHTGNKPYKCPHCDYSCTQKSSLKVHCNSVHSTEKPFQCHHCQYSCKVKGSLKVHLMAVHPTSHVVEATNSPYTE